MVTYRALQDQSPDEWVGLQSIQIRSRKLSLPGVQANIASLLPAVRRTDVPGERRYTFKEHTYVRIGGVDYDLLMGTQGAAVAMTFPVDVEERPGKVFVCRLPPPPAAAPPVPGAPPAPAQVDYWMRSMGGDWGPLPEYELVRV